MYTKPTTIENDIAVPPGNYFNAKQNAFQVHNTEAITRIEVLRNGVRVLDLSDANLLQDHVNNYYRLKYRHRTRHLWSSDENLTRTGFFLDLSRGDVPRNNDAHQVVKTINGLKNFTQEYGEFIVRVYGDWATATHDNELHVIAHATRLFHIGDRTNGWKFHEEV